MFNMFLQVPRCAVEEEPLFVGSGRNTWLLSSDNDVFP